MASGRRSGIDVAGPSPSLVPSPLGRIYGRELELTSVGERLATSRLVTITGIGGCGKTRLATEAGWRLARRGRWVAVIDLAAARRASDGVDAIARTLGVWESATADLRAAVSARLGAIPAPTLVLDNLEQLSEAGQFVADLLRSLPQLRILATSRRRLALAGESELSLGPLATPIDETRSAVEDSPAGLLMLARAREVGALVALTEDDAHHVARLCRRLDGLPLAIELAARSLRILSPGELERRLARHAPSLPTGDATIRASMENVLRWSMSQLDEGARECLARVAICPAGFDLDMAAALCPRLDVVGATEAAVSLGLLRMDRTTADVARFRLLETARDHLLASSGSGDDDVRGRHAEYVSARFGEAARRFEAGATGEAVAGVRNLELDFGLALGWLRSSDPGRALELAVAAAPYWLQRGTLRAPAADLGELLELVPPDHPARASGLLAMGEAARYLEGEGAAIRWFMVAVEAAEVGPSRKIEARALYSLGFAAANVGDRPLAERSAAALEALAESGGGPLLLGMRDSILGSLAWAEQDWEASIRHYADAAERAAAMGDSFRQGISRLNSVGQLLALGRAPEACDVAGSALALISAVNTGPALVTAHAQLGVAELENGQPEAARRNLLAALEHSLAAASPEPIRWACESAVPYLLRIGLARLAGKAAAARSGSEPPGGAPFTPGASHLIRERLAEARRGRSGGEIEIGMRHGRAGDLETVAREVVAALTARHGPPPAARQGQLTAREVDVLALLGEGRSDVDIAAALGISPKTVSVHVSNAKVKLGARNRLELALRGRDVIQHEAGPGRPTGHRDQPTRDPGAGPV